MEVGAFVPFVRCSQGGCGVSEHSQVERWGCWGGVQTASKPAVAVWK